METDWLEDEWLDRRPFGLRGNLFFKNTIFFHTIDMYTYYYSLDYYFKYPEIKVSKKNYSD